MNESKRDINASLINST